MTRYVAIAIVVLALGYWAHSSWEKSEGKARPPLGERRVGEPSPIAK